MSAKIGFINSTDYTKVVKKLRAFFDARGFEEVHTQTRLSILAACEDPKTISTYNYAGQVWPLPQTGQMWLEYELLSNPNANGYYCVSTSYRNEPNPVPGRHDKVFPMFEFEMKGGMEEMKKMEEELLDHLGFNKFYSSGTYPEGDYMDVAEKYGTKELEHEHEEKLRQDYGPVFFLKHFPNYSSPFWNMKQAEDSTIEGGHAKKIDVIINGIETIGSAQRSTDPAEMRKQFYNISDGGYANILFSNFTKERVEKELDEFLSFNFFERSGGGIGLTRLIKVMKESDLL
jgi:aspartyl/asparaginyl-tRNA synthetase|uniref:Aminoacyl-tRNA synthetase class II (D/K/N) domain-containing protein n=1 Tax=viral metagenome TaxID=1070528 RepID=A0A6C0JPJ7_9ZZZZ